MKYLKAIALCTVAMSVVSHSFADNTATNDKYEKIEHHRKFDGDEYRGRSKHDYMKEMMSREFTAEEVKTLVSARLLMRGENTLKVGKIMPTDTGYTATIVTKQNGDVVRTLNLAKNGFPLERVARWKEKHSS